MYDQVGYSVLIRRKCPGVKGHQEENEHLRAECSDCKNSGIGYKSFVFIHGETSCEGFCRNGRPFRPIFLLLYHTSLRNTVRKREQNAGECLYLTNYLSIFDS